MSADQIFCFLIWACLMLFSWFDWNYALLGKVTTEVNFHSHHISLVCVGGTWSQHDITVVSLIFMTLLRHCLPGFSIAKLKCLIFYVKSIHVLCDRYLSYFLDVPFFAPFSYNHKSYRVSSCFPRVQG